MIPSQERSKATALELGLAILAVAAAATFSFLDWSNWHPGFNGYDEEAVVTRVQLAREGLALPMVAFRGCLSSLLQFGSSSLLGPQLGSLHAPILAGFILECFCLWLLARRIFSSRAAAWAVLANVICAFSLFRERCLLSYAFVPLEWLAFMLWLPSASKKSWAFAWGLAASALLLDYEAWSLGLLGLAAAHWLLHRGKGGTRWAWLGLALGAGTIAMASRNILQGHLALRLAMAVPHGPFDFLSSAAASLKSFWLGGDSLYFISAKGQPIFPVWAWPLLLLGLGAAWARWRSGLAWICLGFVPFLLARDSAAEPQRALLAWPALCLIAGAGAERIVSWLPRAGLSLALALCLAGAGLEGRAYLQSIHEHYVLTYGDSANLLAAVQELKATEKGPRRFITDLGSHTSAPLRFLLADLKQAPDSPEIIAFVPREFGPALRGNWGRLQQVDSAVSQQDSPAWLLSPLPGKAKRLEAIEGQLLPLWASVDAQGSTVVRQAALDYLDAHPQADPWLRTACWEAFLSASITLRQLDPQRVAQAMREPLLSATFYEWMAGLSLYENTDPKQALRYAEAAVHLDPHRENSRRLFQQAQQRLRQAP